MWLILAILSAVFAALTSILAKIGIDGVNSTLATAIRTCVVLVMSWGMVFLTNVQGGNPLHLRPKLAVSHSLRPCHRCFLAVLLSRAAIGGSVQGGAYRQAQRGHYADSGFRHFEGALYRKVRHRRSAHHRRDPDYGAVTELVAKL